MMHGKSLYNLNAFQRATRSVDRFRPYSFLCYMLSAAVLLTGCETMVSSPSSVMTAAQSPANPSASALARTGLAAQFIQDGNLDAAQRSLAQALESDPRSPDANNMMGVLLQRAGGEKNQKKAEEYFKRAISYKEDFAPAHNNYGVYLSARKRYPEAYKQFEMAANQLGYSDRASALENLGMTALVLGKTAEAQDAFIRALEVNRKSVVAHVELAELFLKQDRVQTANQLYNQYLKLDANQPQSARSLWLGMRIAKKTLDLGRLQFLSERLELEYPESNECKQYHELLKSGAAWN
jgi:type IV pilus assembly protein PilF